MQYCMCYMLRKLEERRYYAYVTDALMAIAENTSRVAGGKTMNGRWYELYITTVDKEDTRSAEEIAEEFVNKYGLIAKGTGIKVKDKGGE